MAGETLSPRSHLRRCGANFSVFSEVAEKGELCLFDEAGAETRVNLPEVSGFCWHGYLPDVEPGRRYGFRVHGPWAPEQGQRCNPHKLLLDPYAKAVEGRINWNEAVFPYLFKDPEGSRNDACGRVPVRPGFHTGLGAP